MIKKEGAKVSYPRIRKKTFETLIKKTTKKKRKRKKREREGNERGIGEESKRKTKKTFGKVRSDSYMFLKIEIRSIEGNRACIEMYMKKGSIGRNESGRN